MTSMHVHSVSNVATYLRELLDSDVHLADLWISGEVSNLSRSSAGHLYFTLKDANAQLRCVFFRAASLHAELASLMENGAQVVAHGRISLYEARGDLQFYVDFIQPEGIGVLAMEFERLKARLQEEGLFDETRKRPLPPFPKSIGVVTSPAGAVFHDICSVLSRRWPLAEVVLAPTAVQGLEAVPGIVAAISRLNQEPALDVIIVARGGGSLEELWAFNEEAVARAIYASRLPVVSAVGHETDFTIADYVADLRAPTPSAAAEMVAPDKRQVLVRLAVQAASLTAGVQALVREGREDVRAAVHRMERCGPSVDRERQRVDDLLRGATSVVELTLSGQQNKLNGFCAQLRSLHPQATLDRGYALVQRNGDIVSSARAVKSGERLGVRVSDGSFPVRVEGAGGRKKRTAAAATLQPSLFGADEGEEDERKED
ncbi:MAG: exodeoxyribonuclease VII large subunit [Dehalococcoidia bacterium]|nr:exodeoxyribonuclease VII large subunit [Dehalococcoidia bacterium]